LLETAVEICSYVIPRVGGIVLVSVGPRIGQISETNVNKKA